VILFALAFTLTGSGAHPGEQQNISLDSCGSDQFNKIFAKEMIRVKLG
jgi:hypothetical protein